MTGSIQTLQAIDTVKWPLSVTAFIRPEEYDADLTSRMLASNSTCQDKPGFTTISVFDQLVADFTLSGSKYLTSQHTWL